MTVEKPIDTAHVWFINAVDFFTINVFVNGEDQPTLTDAKTLKIGPRFEVDGTAAKPFQTYGFQIRPKDDPSRGFPDAGVLAEASVDLQKGRSFTGVFHYGADPETYALSIFENTFQPSGNGRLEVRHTALPAQMTWAIEPTAGADPAIPFDSRTGTLQRGQWQKAFDLVENDYRLEVRVDGRLFAFHKDLEIESEKSLVTYFVGNPQPDTTELNDLEDYLLVQEFKLPPGPRLAKTTTDPREAFANSNANQPVSFEVPELEVFQTNPTKGTVTATDPDGYITDIGIKAIDPDLGSIRIPDGGVAPSPELGARGSALICIDADTPAGTYAIDVWTNPESAAQTAVAMVPLTIKAITVERLRALVDAYAGQDRIEPAFADELRAILDEVAAALAQDAPLLAQQKLTTFADRVESLAGGAIQEQPSKDLSRESKAFIATLEQRVAAINEPGPCAT